MKIWALISAYLLGLVRGTSAVKMPRLILPLKDVASTHRSNQTPAKVQVNPEDIEYGRHVIKAKKAENKKLSLERLNKKMSATVQKVRTNHVKQAETKGLFDYQTSLEDIFTNVKDARRLGKSGKSKKSGKGWVINQWTHSGTSQSSKSGKGEWWKSYSEGSSKSSKSNKGKAWNGNEWWSSNWHTQYPSSKSNKMSYELIYLASAKSEKKKVSTLAPAGQTMNPTAPFPTYSPTGLPLKMIQQDTRRYHDMTWISDNEVQCGGSEGFLSKSNDEELVELSYYYQVETKEDSNGFIASVKRALLRGIALELLECGDVAAAEQVRALSSSGRGFNTGVLAVTGMEDKITSYSCTLNHSEAEHCYVVQGGMSLKSKSGQYVGNNAKAFEAIEAFFNSPGKRNLDPNIIDVSYIGNKPPLTVTSAHDEEEQTATASYSRAENGIRSNYIIGAAAAGVLLIMVFACMIGFRKYKLKKHKEVLRESIKLTTTQDTAASTPTSSPASLQTNHYEKKYNKIVWRGQVLPYYVGPVDDGNDEEVKYDSDDCSGWSLGDRSI